MEGGQPPYAPKLRFYATHRAGFKRQPATPGRKMAEVAAVFQNVTVAAFCFFSSVQFYGFNKKLDVRVMI